MASTEPYGANPADMFRSAAGAVCLVLVMWSKQNYKYQKYLLTEVETMVITIVFMKLCAHIYGPGVTAFIFYFRCLQMQIKLHSQSRGCFISKSGYIYQLLSRQLVHSSLTVAE